MCEWNSSNDEVCEQRIEGISLGIRQEVWSEVRPHLVNALVHFSIHFIFLLLLFIMWGFSFLMLFLCESLVHEVPILIKITLYFFEVLLSLRFAGQLIKLPSAMSCQLLIAKYTAFRLALNRL
jgi:hypothetical protein